MLEYEANAERFLSRDAYTRIEEIDPNTGHIVLKIRIADFPDALPKLVSHAVWDLKHSLDHATNAAIAAVTGNSSPDDIHFPFRSSPADLQHRLDRHFPVELHPIFRSFEPCPTGNGYAGGSDKLCAFNKLANATKHLVALDLSPRVTMSNFKATGGLVRLLVDGWDGAENELTVGHFEVGTPTDVQLQITGEIAFRDVAIFQGNSVSDVLRAVGRAIENIIEAIEAEAYRITGRLG